MLFCLEKDLQGDWKTERKFDLYYYDGLANQEEEIRLTVGMYNAVTLHLTPCGGAIKKKHPKLQEKLTNLWWYQAL